MDEIAAASSVDPWFVDQMSQVWERAEDLRETSLDALEGDRFLDAKRAGLSDARIAFETGSTEIDVRARREALGLVPVFKSVDTCGGEFPAQTPYHYSTYEEESEVTSRPRGLASSSWEPGPTGSARGSSSTTSACTPRSPWRTPDSSRS